MSSYWAVRRHEALEQSLKAPTAELRNVYLRVAEHYRSLEEWCHVSAPRMAA